MLRFDVLTLFPEIFSGLLTESLIGRAIEGKLLEVELINSIESIDRSMRSESDLVADFGIKPIPQQLVDLRDFIKEHASCYPKYIDSSID